MSFGKETKKFLNLACMLRLKTLRVQYDSFLNFFFMLYFCLFTSSAAAFDFVKRSYLQVFDILQARNMGIYDVTGNESE